MTTAARGSTAQTPFWLVYERLVQAMAVLGGIVFVLATILVLTEICARYFFRRPIMGAVEITEYCLVWVTFLAAPWVQSRNGNVRVEFIIDGLVPRHRAFLDTITALLAAAACAVLTYAGFQTVWSHHEMGYALPTPLHPSSAPIICIIPVSTFLLMVQFGREASTSWRQATRG